jgi:hypothetical protein
MSKTKGRRVYPQRARLERAALGGQDLRWDHGAGGRHSGAPAWDQVPPGPQRGTGERRHTVRPRRRDRAVHQPQGSQAGRRRRRSVDGFVPGDGAVGPDGLEQSAGAFSRTHGTLPIMSGADAVPMNDAVPTARALDFDGCVNFRDLGGYPTRDGRRTRWRRLFRADGLNKLTDADQAQLIELGVATVIDLRTADEAEHRGRFPVDRVPVRYVDLPLTDVLPATEELPEWSQASYVASRYADMVAQGAPALSGDARIRRSGSTARARRRRGSRCGVVATRSARRPRGTRRRGRRPRGRCVARGVGQPVIAAGFP